MELNPSEWHHIPDISCYNHNWYRMNKEAWRTDPVWNPKNYSDDFWEVCAPFIEEECDDADCFTYSLYNNLSDFFCHRYTELGSISSLSSMFDDEVYADRIVNTDEEFLTE